MENRAAGTPAPQAARPIITMLGGRVALGPLRDDLLPTYQRWHKEFTALRTLAGLSELDPVEESEPWYADLSATDEHTWFTIYEARTWRPIGITGLIDIDFGDRSAEYFLQIGDLIDQGEGYGTEVSQLMRDYAFTVLSLESLFLMSYEFNLAGLRACETAGFREFGRQRQAHLMGGRLWDIVYMECLASDSRALPLIDSTIPPPQF